MDNIITVCEKCEETYSANLLNCNNSLIFCKNCQEPKFVTENKNSVFYQITLNKQRATSISKKQNKEVLEDIYG